MTQAKFKTVVQFHGILLTVVSYDDKDYIPLKPVVEMLGTQWKTARETAFSGDNRELYGTCELNEPIFNSFSTLKGAKKSVFILLEAAEMYLARVNTSRLKANGNKSSAEYLLNLQKEWRKALHDYETNGFAAKPSISNIDVIAKVDRIKNPDLKRLAAEQANKDYALNIPIARQTTLDSVSQTDLPV
jgi:hypothetical protein